MPRKFWQTVLDVLTLGVTARLRAIADLNSRIDKAGELIAKAKDAAPRWTLIQPWNQNDPNFIAYIAQVHADGRWQWFYMTLRERFVQQLSNAVRQTNSTENSDVHTGALIALDILNTEMANLSATNARMSANAINSRPEE